MPGGRQPLKFGSAPHPLVLLCLVPDRKTAVFVCLCRLVSAHLNCVRACTVTACLTVFVSFMCIFLKKKLLSLRVLQQHASAGSVSAC